MDVELWQLRYVVAVADELNFTRAAARLHMSQPALSTRIRELEERLGVQLFERTSRKVTITPAGAVLAERGRMLLADARTAVAAAREAASASPVLTVGVAGTAGAVLYPLVTRRFGAARPDATLRATQLTGRSPIDAADIDVAFTRLERDETALELAPLLRERRVLALADSHPLAGAGTLRLSDLDGQRFVTQRQGVNPRFRDRWLAEQRRGGLPGEVAQEVTDAEELFAVLAAGDAVCLLPATVSRYYDRPGLTYLKVTDADTSLISLAWRPAAARPLLDAFVSAARETAAELLGEPGQTTWLAPEP